MLQSVLFDRHLWTLEDAILFLKEHKYKHNKVDETNHYFRFRQISPDTLRKKGFHIFRNKKLKNGISLILGYIK